MKVNVTATRCIVENDVELNAGEYNINKFYFTFSPEYLDNYVKKALFVAKDKPPIEMVIANDECDIPNDILKKPGVYMVGVYAYEIDENNELILRYSPEPTHFYVNRGSYIENAETPTEPDPDEFDQYYQAMQDLIATAKPEFKEYIDENLPTVEVGEVETLPPGSQATVTNSGTDRNPIFNFGIPEGLKGDSVGAIEIDSNDETYQIKMKLYDNNRQIIAESNTIDLPIENKVDKINGKSLSANDFTNELKNKLDNVEDYAEVNVIQTISKNGTPITVEGKNVNIVVPTNTSDLNNDSDFITSEVDDLENYYDKTVSDNKFALITESGKIIDLSIDDSTYVMTITLKDRDANVLSSSDVDLPLETMVINASYDGNTKEIVLTLKNGNTTRFSVAGLVSGLQSEITSTNKLKSDLVDDNKQTNKFVTLNEKTTWNNKSDFSGSYNDLTDVPTIPTQLDELSDDSTHRLVTDDERTTWNSKQSLLVSGTNIKTINNESILGSGNITIEGGGTVNTYYLVNILNMTSTSDATYEIVNDLINNNQFVIFDDPDGRSRELFCYVPIKTYYQSDLDIQTFWYIDNQDKYNLVVITHSGTSVTVIRTTYHSIEEAYNLADGKQNALVSGTNIKTINNQSILGSGNITIEGGGSGTVDTAMSDSSTNAVQNRVIKSYVDDAVSDIDLTDYVKNTDYATNSVGGVIKTNSNAFSLNANNYPQADIINYASYLTAGNNIFVGKGTLENVITGKDLTTKAYVDNLVGDIESILTTLDVGGGV